jgi:hypothetical protein
MANQTGCSGYNPVNITMASGPAGSPGYNWRWYYWENTTQVCPVGSTVPAGAITSNTDSRFFSSVPASSGAAISFDPQSAGSNGRTWAVLISPAGNSSTPACGTPRFAGICHRTLKSAGCREAVSGNPAQDVLTEAEENPAEAVLNPVFPNPGSGCFLFRYFIPSTCNSARILIRNTGGKTVSEIVIQPGKIGWNELSYGLNLPSGLYYYGLETDGIISKMEKLMIVK